MREAVARRLFGGNDARLDRPVAESRKRSTRLAIGVLSSRAWGGVGGIVGKRRRPQAKVDLLSLPDGSKVPNLNDVVRQVVVSWMEAHGYSENALAERLGISQSNLNRFLGGGFGDESGDALALDVARRHGSRRSVRPAPALLRAARHEARGGREGGEPARLAHSGRSNGRGVPRVARCRRSSIFTRASARSSSRLTVTRATGSNPPSVYLFFVDTLSLIG